MRPMLRLARLPLAASLRRDAVRRLSSTPPLPPRDTPLSKAGDEEVRKDAFRGMPSSKMPMPGLVLLLTIAIAFSAYDDWTRKPEVSQETPEEHAARLLKLPPDDIARVMQDGDGRRVLLKDGSIRKL